jgi:hypothetical protein
LPLVLQAAVQSEMPPPIASSRSFVIEFGVGVDGAGALRQPGTVFQHGVPSLVARIHYRDVIPGTVLRWAWSHDGQPLEVPGIGGRQTVAQSSGTIDSVIVGAGGQPLPLGTYELAVADAAGGPRLVTAAARIQREPPPGATSMPTATPAPLAVTR